MEFVAAILLFAACFAAMGIGVLLRGKSLQRSCGGVGEGGACATCGRREGGACART